MFWKRNIYVKKSKRVTQKLHGQWWCTCIHKSSQYLYTRKLFVKTTYDSEESFA